MYSFITPNIARDKIAKCVHSTKQQTKFGHLFVQKEKDRLNPSDQQVATTVRKKSPYGRNLEQNQTQEG